MKKIHIIGLLMILIAAVILISASGDVSSYGTFTQANATDRVKIAGDLAKDRDIVYNPTKDPNYFSFFMKDADGNTKQVVLNQPKPQDFEMSESIVVTGSMKEDIFYASDILLKCPSKYKNEEISIRGQG